MIKIYKKIIFLTFLLIPFSSNSHVQHYENLNRIAFEIYRNDKLIGSHIFSFKKIEEQLEVKSERTKLFLSQIL